MLARLAVATLATALLLGSTFVMAQDKGEADGKSKGTAAGKEKPKTDPNLEKWKGHTGKVDWVMGFKAGQAEAKFTGKPMMVFFTTTW